MAEENHEEKKGESYIEEFFRKLYDFEHERRQKIRAAVAFPAGVLGVLGGLIGFYAQQCPPTLSPFWPNGLLALMLVVIGATFGWTVYWLVMAYWPLLETAYIASPSQIYDYMEKLCEHYKEDGCEVAQIDGRVEVDLRHFLSVQYVQCTELNEKNNDHRQKRLNFSSLGMMALIGMLGISFIPSYFAYHSRDTIQKMRVVNPVELKKEDDIDGKRSETNKSGRRGEATKAGAAADSNSEGR